MLNRLAAPLALTVALALGADPAGAGAGDCAECHGRDGASTESDVPSIGGLSTRYLLDSMAAYRDRKRPCPESAYRAGDRKRPKSDMCRIAAALGQAETARVAGELAAKPFVRARQVFDPGKATAGKKIHDAACEKCHTEGGALADDDAGILAGQWMPYLEATFDQYARGTRPQPAKMKTKVDGLKPADVEALLHYYASQP